MNRNSRVITLRVPVRTLGDRPPACRATDQRSVPQVVLLGALSLALVLAATGAAAIAGDLDPPPGPILPTMKTLDEVEPRIAVNASNTPGDDNSLFKITQPGSYFLTGNITGVAGKHGIEIEAAGVTLDLNGFDLAGIPAMGNVNGVTVSFVDLTDVAVLNGSVRNWGDDGVNLGSPPVSGCRLEGVRASGNTHIGIYTGRDAQVSGCSSVGGQFGIYASNGSTLAGCSARGASISGLSVDFGCVITNCSAYANPGTGISADSGSTLSNCSAYLNTGTGISADSGSTLTNCSAYNNAGVGISVGDACTLSSSSAFSNDGDGFNAGNGCTVVGCSARLNVLDGIRCTSGSVIRSNTCAANGAGGDGAGIHAASTDNLIEGNNCSGADRGIDVDLAGNIIIKNTCSGNTTNYDIVANNVYGPIIDRTAPASPAVLGNSADSSLGSTDANANFSY